MRMKIALLLSLILLSSCSKGIMTLSGIAGNNSDDGNGNAFVERGLSVVTFNLDDGGSVWSFDSEGDPLEKLVDSALIPTNTQVIASRLDFDTCLLFLKVNMDTEYHLYKLVLSTKTFEKLKEFDAASINPNFFDEILPKISGNVLFVAEDSANGYELWKTDGTAAGTVLVKDIFAGAANGINNSTDATFFNGAYYFAAQNSADDYELWRTDGTTAGTYEVTNLNPDLAGIQPYSFKILGNYLLFNFVGSGLWHINSSEVVSGTGALISPNGDTILNGKIYYELIDTNDATSKVHIYDPATSSLTNLSAGSVLSASGEVKVLGKADDKVYFLKRDTGNIQLYTTQGTEGTTSLVGTVVNDGSADQINAEDLGYFDNGMVLITLDHTNNGTTEVNAYKVENNTVTNITSDIFSSLGIAWTEYTVYFLSDSTYGNSDMSVYENGEYKVMVSNQATNYTILAKTTDLQNYTQYAVADPSLVIDFSSQLKYYMGPLYGKFYYGYGQVENNGEIYYLNDYYFPMFF